MSDKSITTKQIPAEEWLAIWKSQAGWSHEWMLQFIKDIQENAKL